MKKNIFTYDVKKCNLLLSDFFLRFEDIWKHKEDCENHNERYYKDMIEREKMVKLETEVRNIVDELMRSELELLQGAFDRDRAHKGKKAKKPQKKVGSFI